MADTEHAQLKRELARADEAAQGHAEQARAAIQVAEAARAARADDRGPAHPGAGQNRRNLDAALDLYERVRDPRLQ